MEKQFDDAGRALLGEVLRAQTLHRADECIGVAGHVQRVAIRAALDAARRETFKLYDWLRDPRDARQRANPSFRPPLWHLGHIGAFAEWWLLIRLAGAAPLNPRYADNVAAYYTYVRDHDLFLTHTLVNPQVDRSKTSAEQEDPYTHLGRVCATAEGIVVRGAKMLGTMAPLCEETMVFPYGGVAPGDDRECSLLETLRVARRRRVEHDIEHPAGTEGRLDRARMDAALAEQRGLLVTDHAGDRRGAVQHLRQPDPTARIDDRRQRACGQTERVERAGGP